MAKQEEAVAAALVAVGVDQAWAAEASRAFVTIAWWNPDVILEAAARAVWVQRLANPGAGRPAEYYGALPSADRVDSLAITMVAAFEAAASAA